MIAAVAHDAGGAELVAHYVRGRGEPVLLTLEGPAVGVFARVGIRGTTVPLDVAVERSEWVLCGTSWQSDLEWRAIAEARRVGRRVIAFIDHWTQFAERFDRGGVQVRPDAVWVVDEEAATLARRALGDVPVTVAGHPHHDALEVEARARGARAVLREDARVVLMVPEATSAHAEATYGNPRHFGYTEIDAAQYFLQHARAAFPSIERIIVRPHPAEPAGKYDWMLDQSPWPVTIETSPTLLEHLLAADGVAGCNTMAMVAALRVGRPVVSYIPPEGPPCALPHRDIVILRDLVAGRVS